MADHECNMCGLPLSDLDVRASEADPRVPDARLLCERHRRQFSACEAVRHNLVKSG